MEYKEGRFIIGQCRILVTKDFGKWHLSISREDRSPSYDEIKEARYALLPDDITMAQIFPPKKEFVNFHPYCHHLFEIDSDISEVDTDNPFK